MFSTPELFTDNSPILPIQYVIIKNHSARKPLYQFSEELYVKLRTFGSRLCADISKQKAIRAGSILWSSITKRQGHSKINQQVKKTPYNWSIQCPQVVQSPIPNDCLRLSTEGQTETQLVPECLLHVFVRGL